MTCLLLVIVVFTSCASTKDPLGVLEINQGNSSEVSGGADRVLWGLWDISIDPESQQAEIAPLRSAMLTANVNQFLDSAAGNLQIKDMDVTTFFEDGCLDCTVALRHPFPGLDMYHGFDVWGVFLHNGTTELHHDNLSYADIENENDAVLLNADGYTRWFNLDEFSPASVQILGYTPGKLGNLNNPSAQLDPYLIFADGLDDEEDYYEWIIDPANSTERGVFRAGSMNSRRYMLRFPFIDDIPIAQFQYAAVASWEEPDPTVSGAPDTYELEDFATSANVEEAFFVRVDPSESCLYKDGEGDYGGDFLAAVEVFDWQGGYGGNGVPEETYNITIEGSFIPNGTHTFDKSELSAVALPASENSSVFMVEITGCEPTECGEALAWVIVEADGVNGESYDQGYGTVAPSSRRAAFLRFPVTIDCEAPYTSIFVDDSNTTGIEDGTKSNPYDTIQEGIDAAVLIPGFDVRVDDSGNPYAENLDMRSGVIVRSENWDHSDGTNRAVIDPPQTENTNTIRFDGVDDAGIEGFTLKFAGINTGNTFAEMIRVTMGSGNSIRDCLITDHVPMPSLALIIATDSENLEITNCRFDDIDTDGSNNGCQYFVGVSADNCPGIVFSNNIITGIRNTPDDRLKNLELFSLVNTTGATIKNNLVHHIAPDATGGTMQLVLITVFDFLECDDLDIANNTLDQLDTTQALSIQWCFCYAFEWCTNVTYTNNIITRIYVDSFPAGMGRGVSSYYENITCNYSDLWTIDTPFYFMAFPGTGVIYEDPLYNNSESEDYDLQPGSLALAGDPSIIDWDDDGSGGSRMGCKGGPGGEYIGLLTPK